MLSAGALIWVSVRPLLRLVLCTASGYAITKADIFPLVAARGAGQIILNIAYPCLMFSKIVPAFTQDNVEALGPLVLMAFLYEFLGVAIAWLVKQFFWVPHRFRYGIIVAGGWSNYGDVPTAVIMSITGAAPFNGTSDQTLSVAYISAFILVFVVTLFPMGGHRLIALDYVGPEIDDDELRMSVAKKTKHTIRAWTHGAAKLRRQFSRDPESSISYDNEKVTERNTEKAVESPYVDEDEKVREKEYAPRTSIEEVADELGKYVHLSHQHGRLALSTSQHISFSPDDTTAVPTEAQPSRICSPAHTDDYASRVPSPTHSDTHVNGESCTHHIPPSLSLSHPQPHTKLHPRAPLAPVPESVGPSTLTPSRSPSLSHRVLAHALSALRSLLTPQALAILIAIPIALITPLKGLFTPTPNSHIPNAPDGQPPLAFILDVCSFIGAASVPLGLICLGSALARLDIPRGTGSGGWRDLPVGAIAGLAVGKMLVMPVLGVLLTEGLVVGGLIKAEQKVLRFVCIFMSCVPTATTQVFLTQVYSGTGSAGQLSAFLIPQYAMMFVSMTALTAYSLLLIF